MGITESTSNESLFFQVSQVLIATIGVNDDYTKCHSERVAEYSREIARRHGLPKEEQDIIYVMALLHDIGKIGVPDAVINKPGRLMDVEYDIVKQHPVLGAEILKNLKDVPSLAAAVRSHHERFDGKGYPDGLAGEDIPVEARIIAVAESYDAMTGESRYRMPLSKAEARAEMEKCSGSQFDPVFAGIMLQMIDEELAADR